MSAPEEFIEVAITIPNNYTDAACNFIIENICNGLILEEEDNSDETIIKFYLPTDYETDYQSLLDEYFENLIELHQELNEKPTIFNKVIKNIEWEEAYKKSVTPVIVTGDVGVRPPWESVPEGVVYDIIIEPKMAFGTGKHETTRSCLKVIRESFKDRMTFLDLGCGSGILSILADKLGSSYIKAVDYDIVSVENCQENFEINQIKAKYDIVLGSIEKCENDKSYDFVCANIIKSTILQILPELKRLTKDSGILVLSGLLDKDQDEIIDSLNALNLNNYNILEDNEWRTFTIKK